MLKLNQDIFNHLKTSSKVLLIAEFFKEGCPHCLQQEENIQELEKAYESRVNFCRLSVQENAGISSLYEIDTLPTLLYIVNGEIKERLEGCQTSLVVEANMHKLFHLVS